MGLLKPDSGNILINNQEIYNNLKVWQKHISYVTQDFQILDDTIKNNIAFGIENNHINEKLIYDCLRKVKLLDFVNKQKKSIYTVIGENGKLLSGGQRQRLILARSLYFDSKIIIFDEATNQLPAVIENEIFDQLKLILKNKIIILISHNKDLINKCDYKIKIENGKIKND